MLTVSSLANDPLIQRCERAMERARMIGEEFREIMTWCRKLEDNFRRAHFPPGKEQQDPPRLGPPG
jgi:hypothetical protein